MVEITILTYIYADYVQFRDHEVRNAWIGPSFPLDLSTLPVKAEEVPLQYPSLRKCNIIRHSHVKVWYFAELGYSSIAPGISLEDRRKIGAKIENILKYEKEAAKAPSD